MFRGWTCSFEIHVVGRNKSSYQCHKRLARNTWHMVLHFWTPLKSPDIFAETLRLLSWSIKSSPLYSGSQLGTCYGWKVSKTLLTTTSSNSTSKSNKERIHYLYHSPKCFFVFKSQCIVQIAVVILWRPRAAFRQLSLADRISNIDDSFFLFC